MRGGEGSEYEKELWMKEEDKVLMECVGLMEEGLVYGAEHLLHFFRTLVYFKLPKLLFHANLKWRNDAATGKIG